MCASERFIILLNRSGTSDFKTECEMLMLPALALFPAFKCTAVFPAEPGKVQRSVHLECGWSKGTWDTNWRRLLSSAFYSHIWVLGSRAGLCCPSEQRAFYCCQVGFSAKLVVNPDE